VNRAIGAPVVGSSPTRPTCGYHWILGRSVDRIVRRCLWSVLASADFRVLLDESVLHRRIGTAEVMAMQLEHLLTMGARPNITIQVIPGAAGAYAVLTGAFAVAEVSGESPTAARSPPCAPSSRP
jgi:hypothetical protein